MSNSSDTAAELMQLAEHLVPGAVGRLGTFAAARRPLEVWICHRFVKRARKARVWATPALAGALKNCEYGFDPNRARSRGGRDGVYLVDREHRPYNEMIRKIYGLLDRGHDELLAWRDVAGVGAAALQGVRVVGHHLRLLGAMAAVPRADVIVLFDVDAES